MVKQFQVGKRYRSGNSTVEYECKYVDEKGSYFHWTNDKNQSGICILGTPALYDIIPPKPRTGKGWAILNPDGSLRGLTGHFMEKDRITIPIEWREITNDNDSAG